MAMAFRHAVLHDRSLDGRPRAYPQDPLPIADLLVSLREGTDIDYNLVLRLFFCYRSASPSDIVALGLIAETSRLGLLRIEPEFIELEPNMSVPFAPRRPDRGRTSESAEHQGMKAWVEGYLRTKGLAPALEVSRLGYHVDVAVLAQSVYVECGDTEPAKIVSFLRSGLAIGILQYDSEEIIWFRPNRGLPTWLEAREVASVGWRPEECDQV